uniref:Uncharacterized protein n=1 Tax=Rhizophora mucronata TaxID=61149 RepID=A0A2P2LWQ5_RHIMU
METKSFTDTSVLNQCSYARNKQKGQCNSANCTPELLFKIPSLCCCHMNRCPGSSKNAIICRLSHIL